MDSVSADFNAHLARQLEPLSDRGGILTVLRIGTEPAGIRMATALGILMGARANPCQTMRDLTSVARQGPFGGSQ